MGDAPASVRVKAPALTEFGLALALAAGVDATQADTLVDNLVWNDTAGRSNHGFERLPVLLDRVAKGGIRCPAKMRLAALSPVMARLDAGGGFGQHAGRLAVDRAIELARSEGLGLVGVANSNFFGTGAYFVARAAQAGLVSMVLSNATPKVAPPEGRGAALGTNPFAFGAPVQGGAPLIVDFATAAMAGSSLRAAQKSGADLPDGAVLSTATDLAQAVLSPAAGAKGFGLALMIEVLSGVLTGAGVGPGVGSIYNDRDRPSDSGHMILTIDPARWMAPEDFAARLAALAAHIDAVGGRLPGAARDDAQRDAAVNGVALELPTWEALVDLAHKLNVALPATNQDMAAAVSLHNLAQFHD